MMLRGFRLATVVGLLAAVVATSTARADQVLVLAAASLGSALEEIADAYAAEGHPRPRLSFAASSVLARQVEHGIEADIFISADQAWMDHLEAARLIDPASRIPLVGNRLVLIAPADSDFALEIAPRLPLAEALGEGRLTIADPAHVPAGRYAQAALQALDAWQGVEARLIRTDNVRIALAFVARGEAAAGIVYATDAQAEPNVRVIGDLPTVEPILYPMARIAGRNSSAADRLYGFLRSEPAQAIFRRHGFLPADSV